MLLTRWPTSSLIFHTEAEQVLVATDTLATTIDGLPVKFTTKAFVVPHLKIIIAGTGAGRFLGRWFIRVNDEMVVRGIDNLDYHTPLRLAALWTEFSQEYQDIGTTTVYHFGFSEMSGAIHAYAYRSANNFCSERIGYGIGVKPKCTVAEGYRLPDDIRKFMNEQIAEQELLPKEERVYIGGEIQIHHLTKDECVIYTLDRFGAYSDDEMAIYRNFANAL